jgi:hypothetical protein
MTTKNEPISETEALRLDLELTRQHLADTVQQLTHQLNVPARLKDSAAQAGQRVQGRMKQVPGQVKDLPAVGKRHPRATAAVGGAVALGLGGAVTWMVRRHN